MTNDKSPLPTRRYLLAVFWLAALCLSACGRPPGPPGPPPAPPPPRPGAAQAPAAADSLLVAFHPVQAGPIDVQPNDWPWWRGRDQNGTVPEQSLPTTWSEEEHVLWKSPVPGRGHSSPVRCGDRVFLTTADEQAKAQSVLAFDFQTGQKLWETIVHRGEFTGIHPKNSHASATPCGDGQRVFAAFLHGEELFVTALDLAGQQLWQTSAGPFHSEHGLGASPALHGAVVIVSGDSRGSAWLAGLHRETGEIVWRTPRAPSTDHGNYASPIVATLAGRPQLLMAGFNHVRGYHPDSGEELWQADGPTHVMGNTLAVSDPWVIASGGYPEQQILGIRVEPSGGGVTARIVWQGGKNVAYVPTPLIAGDQALILADSGTLAAFGLTDGKLRWQHRLGGDFTASLVRAGDLLLAHSEKGETTLFRAAPDFQLVAKNRLSDPGGMATPAVTDGRILLRTDHALYCLGLPR